VGNDRDTAIAPVLARSPDFAELLAAGEDAEMALRLRRAETIGRPVDDEAFLNALERQSGRGFQSLKRGPRPRQLIHCRRNYNGRIITYRHGKRYIMKDFDGKIVSYSINKWVGHSL
jgi:hypothetical protein